MTDFLNREELEKLLLNQKIKFGAEHDIPETDEDEDDTDELEINNDLQNA